MTDLIHRRTALRAALGFGVVTATAPMAPGAALSVPVEYEGVSVLSVGIDDYKYLPPLNSSVADAGALASVFPSAYVRRLINPDRDSLKDGLQRLAMETTKWAVFIFAGHGIRRDGCSHLAPRDAVLDAEGTPRGTVTGAEIRAQLAGARARNLLLLIDACNCVTDLVPTGRPGTVLALLAGTGGRPVSDGRPGSNSPFTRTLLTALSSHRCVQTNGHPAPTALISTVQRLHSSTTQGISTILLDAGTGAA